MAFFEIKALFLFLSSPVVGVEFAGRLHCLVSVLEIILACSQIH